MEIKCSYTKLVSVDELKPREDNPNRHTVEQIEQCAEIIEYSGWRNPIVVSNLDGIMTKGHLRLEAAMLRGWKEVPVDFQDYYTVEQQYADVVADNELGKQSQLDYQLHVLTINENKFEIDQKYFGLRIDPIEEVEIKEKELDENIDTDKECPSCGYKW